MKTHAMRSLLLAAAFITSTATLFAAPALSVEKPPVIPNNYTGPAADPMSTNGQWFVDNDGNEEYRPYEFHDNVLDHGGGNTAHMAISGMVDPGSIMNASGAVATYGEPITAFKIHAVINNDTGSEVGQEAPGSNSHDEMRDIAERYVGTLYDTKLAAEFAIADLNLLPSLPFTYPYQNNNMPSYIIADDEDQKAWYCWSPVGPQGEPVGEVGNYYVPTWDFGDIPQNQSTNRMLSFSIDPPMDPTDPRYDVIFSPDDIFANRTTSLKISTWIDTIQADVGVPYPEEPLRGSDVSVFHNDEPTYDPPHKMHYPQLPDPNGWDVRACFYQMDERQKVLADDFRCTSNGPITSITFWGSFQYDEYNYQAEFHGVTNIHLSLHKDIPDPDGDGPGYSMPVVPEEWKADINPYNPPTGWTVRVIPEEPSMQGWYDPNLELVQTNNHMNYFRYEITLPADEAFVQTEGEIYWLDVSVQTENGYMWGWKTSVSEHFNDDGVWADMPVVDTNQWKELIDPLTLESLDLAFVIDGEPPLEDEYDFGDLPDTYGTLLISGGAQHTIVQGIYLGTAVDAESDGQPSAAADGDDLNGATPDDEDGVSFGGPIVAGQSAPITVTASIGGTLEIWMDLNNNGTFLDAGENLLTIIIPAGTTGMSLPIPVSVMPGPNAMRFRFNTLGATGSPTGPAVNGEVEDYSVTVEELDWGDALDNVVPTGYPTLSVNNGARHVITALMLGNIIDGEPDGQASNGADGDDLWDGTDDEDGITFDTPIIPGAWAQITVTVSGSVGTTNYLQGWVDFYGNTNWTDSGEQVFTDQPLVSPGTYTLSFPVPATASNGVSHARFRLSSSTGLSFNGLAYDGEVEDYEVEIETFELDWGDAFDQFQSMVYPTLNIHNGAHHVITWGILLGTQLDPEIDGQPNPAATGDDINALDDEDGVQFTTLLQPGGTAGVDVIAPLGGTLDAWIDFNADGDWADSGERIFNGAVLVLGTNSLTFSVPTSAVQGAQTTSRFRLSSSGVASYTGLALDGEVEDHLVDIITIESQASDFGDADIPYVTLLPNGAQHTITPGLVLGSIIDPEIDGQPTPDATGDDLDLIGPSLGDDEDGVNFVTHIIAGSNAVVDVIAGVSGGTLDAWIDFNADLDWNDPGEQIITALPLVPGLNAGITFPVPGLPAQALGPTMARFRLSSLGSGGLSPDNTGIAIPPLGEVEDYMVELYQPVPVPDLTITNIYVTVSNTTATVEWNSQSGIIYQMQNKTSLTNSTWLDVGTQVTGPVNWQTNSAAPTNQFYRVTAPNTP